MKWSIYIQKQHHIIQSFDKMRKLHLNNPTAELHELYINTVVTYFIFPNFTGAHPLFAHLSNGFDIKAEVRCLLFGIRT